ncbi:hypothetical protein ACHAWF_017363 [Thalassiosira exigua]
MVFEQKKSKPNAAYINTDTSTTKRSSTSSTAEIKKIVDYCATLDGSPEAAMQFQQAFHKTFHPDVIIELPGGKKLTYKDAINCFQAATNKGGYPDLLAIVDNHDGTADMTISNTVPGLEVDVTRQVAYFKEGKVVRVRAVEQDEKKFGNVILHCERCIPPTNKAEIQKLVDYFAILDGSPDAAKKFQRQFNDTFHPDVVIELPGSRENLNYQAAVECIQAGLNRGSRADLIEIVENNDGTATMTICNNVPGLKDDVTRQVAYFKEGKVIRVHAVDQDKSKFGNMVSHYQRCAHKASIPEIQKLVDYFAIFDGSPGAVKQFQQAFRNTFHPDVVCELQGNSNLGYDDIFECVIAGMKNGSRSDLLDVVSNEDGTATVTICNNVPGLKDDVTRQVLSFKEGKVVQVHAVDQDAAQFGNMVAHYQRCILSN